MKTSLTLPRSQYGAFAAPLNMVGKPRCDGSLGSSASRSTRMERSIAPRYTRTMCRSSPSWPKVAATTSGSTWTSLTKALTRGFSLKSGRHAPKAPSTPPTGRTTLPMIPPALAKAFSIVVGHLQAKLYEPRGEQLIKIVREQRQLFCARRAC
jgi:hypothetical protein